VPFISCVPVAQFSTSRSTTTGFGVARSKAIAKCDTGFSAVTLAKPQFFAPLIAANWFNSYEMAKAHSGNVFEGIHDGLSARRLWQVAGWRDQRRPAALV
jgi:hypothetical protein